MSRRLPGAYPTGIYPTDELPVLERLPTFKHPHIAQISPQRLVGESFVQFLEDKRKSVVGSSNAGPKKKLNIAAGKSISSEELKKGESEPTTSKTKKPTKKKKPVIPNADDDETDAEDSIEVELEDESEYSSEVEDEVENDIYQKDDYVIVEYEGEFWPGQVQTKENEGAYIKCMIRCGLSGKWPEKDDIIFYPNKDIKYKINPPKKLSSKRAVFQVPELESRWGK